MDPRKVTIIGGGIVGLATALSIARKFPHAETVVLEKEISVGRHQSGHNSGVLHAGLYYQPGSAKARLAVRGIRMMIAFCREHGIAHEICGKLVVATEAGEIPRLHNLFERGQKNGLQGLQLMRSEELREIEPHVNALEGIRVPEEGIVDYGAVCERMASLVHGRVITRAKVHKIHRDGSGWVCATTAGDFASDLLINCAGLHCDRVSEMAGVQPDLRIIPFRGEYYKIKPERQQLVRNLIYPVPDPNFPFLGVHFTRLIHGGVEAGPNAVLALAREGYRKTDVNLRDVFDALTFPGLWAFLRRYPRMCWRELQRSFSKDLFCRSLQRLVPEIQISDLETGGAGVRAQAMSPNGETVQDFHIITRDKSVHVLNAPSPGATASLAIGEEIVARLDS